MRLATTSTAHRMVTRAVTRAVTGAGLLAAALALGLAAVVAGAPGARAGDAPAVGDEAPDFTLKNGAGADVKLSSFRGQQHVLVAFYPRDFTPG